MNRFLLIRTAMLLAAPNEGSGGSAPEKPKTLATALVALGTAEASVETERQRADAAELRATEAETERDRLSSQFDAATQAAAAANTARETAEADLVTARASITTLTGERDAAVGRETKANVNIARLEALCGVKGIDKNAAAPSGPANPEDGAGETMSLADFDKLSHVNRNAFMARGGKLKD